MYQRFLKRFFDLILGLLALPFVLLATVFLAPFIYFEDRGPVFYNAARVGKNGKIFTMYKFRSMKIDSPDLVMPDGSTYNGLDDPRMTRVGQFLRKTSIDELPQFINVLLGTMSVVGPRPDLERETELYQGDEAEKLLVKPGITGHAAVYGRNSLGWHDRLALDVFYVRNLSFLLDTKIFFKTFVAVLSQKGVFVEDNEGT
ncbi:MAG: sugar transferase [Eggerthellaceae bacterium]|jgi:lipopolysaccharide/colanic/teichoic acid biosynthesis glycosyltransferase|nr:sugar transferase [Eggerthellaceae bacterium]